MENIKKSQHPNQGALFLLSEILKGRSLIVGKRVVDFRSLIGWDICRMG